MSDIKWIKFEISTELYDQLKEYGRLRSLSVPGVFKAVAWEAVKAEEMLNEYGGDFKDAMEKAFDKVLPELTREVKKKEKEKKKSKRA